MHIHIVYIYVICVCTFMICTHLTTATHVYAYTCTYTHITYCIYYRPAHLYMTAGLCMHAVCLSFKAGACGLLLDPACSRPGLQGHGVEGLHHSAPEPVHPSVGLGNAMCVPSSMSADSMTCVCACPTCHNMHIFKSVGCTHCWHGSWLLYVGI